MSSEMTTTNSVGPRTWNAKQQQFVYSLLITGAVLAVFLTVRNHPFLGLDDGRILFDNPVVSKGLSVEGFIWAFQTMSFTYWQPIPLI